ncbi:MAG: hypothetical protein WBC44_18185 [Planctomycetaceae bacterium]
MEVPVQWREYSCADYFNSSLSDDGFWDEPGQLWLIEPNGRVEEVVEANFLQVGRPGVDGIGFGYRKGHVGFWAYHPVVDEFQHLAPSVQEFLEGWFDGRITV